MSPVVDEVSSLPTSILVKEGSRNQHMDASSISNETARSLFTSSDSNTASSLTLDDTYQTPRRHRHSSSQRSSSLRNASLRCSSSGENGGGNALLPRVSLAHRMSDKANDLELSKLRFDHLPLFGRDEAMATMTRTFESILTRRARALVLVKGESGTGKTSLVVQNEALRRTCRRNRGILAMGKCEQQPQQQSPSQQQQYNPEPYASVKGAMSMMCHKLGQLPRRSPKLSTTSSSHSNYSSSTASDGKTSHASNKVTLDDVQEKLQHNFEPPELELLMETIPGLSGLVLPQQQQQQEEGEEPAQEQAQSASASTTPSSSLDSNNKNNDSNKKNGASSKWVQAAADGASFQETSDRLKYMYRRFLRIISGLCPLILVLDDCQWADTATLDWLQSLLTDTDNTGSSSGKNRNNKNNNNNLHEGSLLVIASYRSNQVHDDHELAKMIARFKESSTTLQQLEQVNNQEETKEEEDAAASTDAINITSNDHENKEHPSMPQQQREEEKLLLAEITLENLSVEDINAMLSELLASHPLETTFDLAQVLYEKTMGNPFFIVELLLQLRGDNYIGYNFGLMKWVWDTPAIRHECKTTDNVADLLKEKLQRSEVALRVLPVAACLGSTFSTTMLQNVLLSLYRNGISKFVSNEDHPRGSDDGNDNINDDIGETAPPTAWEVSHEGVETQINMCQLEGFVEPVEQWAGDASSSSAFLRFRHDRLQEACFEPLLPEAKIGIVDFFLAEFSEEEWDNSGNSSFIFSVTSLVNQHLDRLSKKSDQNVRKCIVMMNALAGKKAMQSAAFESASRYLTIAISFLQEDYWTTHKGLALGVYVLAGAAKFCTGDHDALKTYTDTILARDDLPLLEKLDLCHTMMDSYEADCLSEKNFEFGLELLKGLNCRFPKSGFVVTTKTIAGLLQIKRNAKKKLSGNALNARPIVRDKQTMALMKTLDKFGSATFHARPDMIPLVVLKMAKYTDRLGLNPFSAVTYPILGLLFAGVLEDFQTAKICAEAGIAIMRRCDYPLLNARCLMMAYLYPMHWSTSLPACLKPLMEGYETGMKLGTLDGAFWCICYFLEYCFWNGEQLSRLHDDYSTYIRQMDDYGNKKTHAVMRYTRHMVARLRGMAEESDEAELLAWNQEHGDDALEAILRRSQMYVACIYGEHEKAADIALEWQPKATKVIPGQYNVLEMTFVSALSCMAVLRRDPKHNKARKYRKHATNCCRKIKSWVAQSCPNCVAHDALLDAESMALENKKGLALKHFESAILLSGRRGLVHLQALANERMSIYLDEVGEPQEANYHLEKAKALYIDWGATGKVQCLSVSGST